MFSFAVTTLLVTIAISFLALVAVLLDTACAWVSTLIYCLDLKLTQAALPFGGMRYDGRSFDVERRCNLLMRFEMMLQAQMPTNEDISNIVDFYNYSRLQRARSDAIIVFVDVLHGGPSVANEETEK